MTEEVFGYESVFEAETVIPANPAVDGGTSVWLECVLEECRKTIAAWPDAKRRYYSIAASPLTGPVSDRTANNTDASPDKASAPSPSGDRER